MKNILLSFAFLLSCLMAYPQFTKVKLTHLLTSDNQKSWMIAGVNVDLLEKKMTFSNNNSVVIETENSKTTTAKWALSSPDNIRWFLQAGNQTYELIVSYNKKGEEYIKLKHPSKGSDSYELKLTTIK